MKRYIRSTISFPVSEIPSRVASARRELAKYDDYKVDYVMECNEAILDAISFYYEDEETPYPEESIGPSISEIKNDYLVGAIEDDMMTEEEFNRIFELIDVIDTESAHAHA